jgi:putative methionine-R-sulfoxide reductase with GAF domain
MQPRDVRLPKLNWAGFYLWRGGQLVVGPFQGKPACVRLERGRGVCGAAALRRTSIIVSDVHQFPGHIACDSASASEIVVPMELPDRKLGVLDLDSPNLGRFDEADRAGLEAVVGILVRATDWPDWEKRLQIRGAGGKSRKRSTLVVGEKPNGKCQVKAVDPFDLPGALLHEYMGGGEHESGFATSGCRPSNRIHLD